MFVRSHLLVFLLVAYSTATSVWVDSATGDDTAAGTQTAPFLTLKKGEIRVNSFLTFSVGFDQNYRRIHWAILYYQSRFKQLHCRYFYWISLCHYWWPWSYNHFDCQIHSHNCWKYVSFAKTLFTIDFFGVYVGGNGTVTFDNISIYPNLGTSSSRVLYVWQSSITLNNCYFADFQVQIGPALYFDGGEANVVTLSLFFLL